MKQTVINLHGLALTVKYVIHPLEKYIEWYLVTEADSEGLDRSNDTLLEMILRVDYTHYIESKIRENEFYEDYARQEEAIAKDDINF